MDYHITMTAGCSFMNTKCCLHASDISGDFAAHCIFANTALPPPRWHPTCPGQTWHGLCEGCSGEGASRPGKQTRPKSATPSPALQGREEREGVRAMAMKDRWCRRTRGCEFGWREKQEEMKLGKAVEEDDEKDRREIKEEGWENLIIKALQLREQHLKVQAINTESADADAVKG